VGTCWEDIGAPLLVPHKVCSRFSVYCHLLTGIRDESVNHRMPTRLIELVNQYPYQKGSSSTDEELLSRPRFSTRPYDALFVRIDTELATPTTEKPKRDRLRLLAEAFKLDLPSEGGEYTAVWDKVKQAAVETGNAEGSSPSKNAPVLNRVFANETIQLLSLMPANGTDAPINLISPMARPAASRRRSSSLSRIPDHKGTNSLAPPNGNVQAKAAATPLPPSPAIDWTEFTTAGFGEASTTSQHLSATLFDDEDVEITDPSVVRKLSRGKRTRDASRRSSADNPNLSKPNGVPTQQKVPALLPSKATLVNIIQLDEAFIDFWSDAAIDPISSSWPTFVICKLNSIPGVQSKEGKPINWLVVEQTYSSPPVPRETTPTLAGKRPSSPKPSVKSDLSRMNSSFSAARRRFSFFGSGNAVSSGRVEKTKSKRKTSLNAATGELGEILPEVQEKPETKADAVTAKGTDIKESAPDPGATELAQSKDGADAVYTKDSTTVSGPVAAEPAKSNDKVDAVDTNEFAVFAGLAVLVGDAAVEKAAPPATQPLRHSKSTTKTSPAPKGILLSSNTSGSQIALGTSESVAAMRPSPAPVKDTPGPQHMSDAEPLKDQEHSSVLPKFEEISIAPISTTLHAPEPTEAESVEPIPPTPEAPEPVNEPEPVSILVQPIPPKLEAPEPVKQVEADPVESIPPTPKSLVSVAPEAVPEPAKELDADTDGPQPAPEGKPATIAPLKDQEETSTMPEVEDIPTVPVLTEQFDVPESIPEAEPVEFTLPTAVADAFALVELAPEVPPEPVKAVEVDAEMPLGAVDDVAPEPTQPISSEPNVESEPETTTMEVAAQPIEEANPEPAAPEAAHDDPSVEDPEPSAEPSVQGTLTEPTPESQELEPAAGMYRKLDVFSRIKPSTVAPPVTANFEEEIQTEEVQESHLPEETPP
jgi:hypothetical protein